MVLKTFFLGFPSFRFHTSYFFLVTQWESLRFFLNRLISFPLNIFYLVVLLSFSPHWFTILIFSITSFLVSAHVNRINSYQVMPHRLLPSPSLQQGYICKWSAAVGLFVSLEIMSLGYSSTWMWYKYGRKKSKLKHHWHFLAGVLFFYFFFLAHGVFCLV